MTTTTKPKLIPMCLKCDTMHYFCHCYGGPTLPNPTFQAWREKFDNETATQEDLDTLKLLKDFGYID
jgi:hypothetical protein